MQWPLLIRLKWKITQGIIKWTITSSSARNYLDSSWLIDYFHYLLFFHPWFNKRIIKNSSWNKHYSPKQSRYCSLGHCNPNIVRMIFLFSHTSHFTRTTPNQLSLYKKEKKSGLGFITGWMLLMPTRAFTNLPIITGRDYWQFQLSITE